MPLYEHVDRRERVYIPEDMVGNNHPEYLRLKDSKDWKQIGVGFVPDPVEEPESAKEPEPEEPEPIGVDDYAHSEEPKTDKKKR